MTSTKQRAWPSERGPARLQGRSAGGTTSVRRYRADELLAGDPWIVIEHGGAEYRLHVTRLGKLILTK